MQEPLIKFPTHNALANIYNCAVNVSQDKQKVTGPTIILGWHFIMIL